MDNRPVGMFDSGAGGLSVYRAFRALAANEDVIYFADTAHFPYGPKAPEQVRERSFEITRRLIEKDVKLIVVACNTASAAAIAGLREAFDLPFVGMVPGVKPATLRSRSGRVTILATPGTLDGELYARVFEEFGQSTRIVAVPGGGLAEMVEAGCSGSERIRELVRKVLAAEVSAGSDTVVLGCTHYCFLAEDIHAVYPHLSLVDTSEAVARRALQVLEEGDARADPGRPGRFEVMVSGERGAFEGVMKVLGFSQEPAK